MSKKPGKYAAKKTSLFSSGAKQKPERQSRPKRKLGLRELLLFGIPALAVVAIAVVTLLLVEHGASYTFSGSATQYYAGNKARIQAGAKLTAQEDGTVTLNQSGTSGTVDLPVYLDGKQELLLSQDMVYYVPRSGQYSRALHFSAFSVLDRGTVTMTREGGSRQMEQGFLYDGRDLYIFLEPMKLHFNGYEMELPALSYVEAVYGGSIMVFDHGTKECILEAADGTGTAAAMSGEYEISLFGDSMTTASGEKTLLVSRPDLIEPIQ